MSQIEAVKLWSDLKGWYQRHLPEATETLNQGAREDAVAKFDRELRQEVGEGFPHELRTVYLENDGQRRGVICGMFFGLEFLSLENASMHWQGWRDLANDAESLSSLRLDELGSSYPLGAIRSAYASAGWLPFAHDGGNNFLGIDLQPGPNGRVGQVINFGRDEEAKYVVAASFGKFLEWLATQHREGNYIIAEHNIDGYVERCVEILNPREESFLDAVPLLFK